MIREGGYEVGDKGVARYIGEDLPLVADVVNLLEFDDCRNRCSVHDCAVHVRAAYPRSCVIFSVRRLCVGLHPCRAKALPDRPAQMCLHDGQPPCPQLWQGRALPVPSVRTRWKSLSFNFLERRSNASPLSCCCGGWCCTCCCWLAAARPWACKGLSPMLAVERGCEVATVAAIFGEGCP